MANVIVVMCVCGMSRYCMFIWVRIYVKPPQCLWSLFTLFFETMSLTAWDAPVWLGWLASMSWICLSPPSQHWKYKRTPNAQLWCGCRGPSLGLHALAVSTLPTELFPQSCCSLETQSQTSSYFQHTERQREPENRQRAGFEIRKPPSHFGEIEFWHSGAYSPTGELVASLPPSSQVFLGWMFPSCSIPQAVRVHVWAEWSWHFPPLNPLHRPGSGQPYLITGGSRWGIHFSAWFAWTCLLQALQLCQTSGHESTGVTTHANRLGSQAMFSVSMVEDYLSILSAPPGDSERC